MKNHKILLLITYISMLFWVSCINSEPKRIQPYRTLKYAVFYPTKIDTLEYIARFDTAWVFSDEGTNYLKTDRSDEGREYAIDRVISTTAPVKILNIK